MIRMHEAGLSLLNRATLGWSLVLVSLVSLATQSAVPCLAEEKRSSVVNFGIKVDQPAYVGMPIWLKAEVNSPRPSHYPYSSACDDFGNNLIEVKRGNKLLAPRVLPGPTVGILNGPSRSQRCRQQLRRDRYAEKCLAAAPQVCIG